MQEVDIGWADPHCSGEVVALLQSVSTWLATDGPGALWNPDQFNEADIAASIARGELVIAKIAGKVVASMLVVAEDRDFWPDDPEGEALYLHKIVVSRDFAGKGLSRKLLDWAADFAASKGIGFLRLDCAPRQALVSHYEQAGFRRVDSAPGLFNGFLAERLERAVLPKTHAANRLRPGSA